MDFNTSLDNCQIDLHSDPGCSEDTNNKTSSDEDNDFEAVEMIVLGENSANKCTDEAGPSHTFSRNQWSAATLRVLSSMPSRSVVKSDAAVHSSLKDFSTTSRAASTESLGDLTYEEPQRKCLLRTLRASSKEECVRLLRLTPLSMTEKRSLKALVCSERDGHIQSAKVPRTCDLHTCIKKTLLTTRQFGHSLLISVQFWHESLKQVSCRFGTGVLSYFLFLRTLLLYNIFFSLIIILFMVVPQATHHQNHRSKPTSFTGIEILVGTGALHDSLMFYGNYNYTGLPETYNIPLAYLLTIGFGLFATCVMLVYSVTLGRTFQVLKSHGNLALKVFSAWDFKVCKKESVRLQSENLCTQFKEMLYEQLSENPSPSSMTRLIRFSSHCVAWFICLACISCCVLAVYLFSQSREKVFGMSETGLLYLPLLVCCVNHLMPAVFNMVSQMEKYNSFSVYVHTTIIRKFLLKVSTLSVLCYHWLDSVATGKVAKDLKCWETFIGQELYRLLVMDLIFTVLFTIFGEFLWRGFVRGVLGRTRKPAFDIGQNVLELIYSQTLAWIGVLFIPVLPAIQSVKLLLLFYLKRTSLMKTCQAPRRPWRATQMTSLFFSLLFFPSFLGAVSCIAYTMWRLTPSSSCGPFRMLTSMLHAGKGWRKTVESSKFSLAWLSFIYALLENSLFLFFTAGLFLLLIYIQNQAGDGQRRIIALLQIQINNEVEDKKFLIHKLQAFHDQHEL